ncbi:MAG: ABC transporter transmembrane domain-containing protein, partial [Lachnospiraceae bacterium]
MKTKTIKKVLRYIKKYKWYLIFSLFLAVFMVAGTLYLPVLIGHIIDAIIAPGQVSFSVVFPILWHMIMIMGITALAQWLMNVCNNKITYEVIQDIRQEAFAKIQILPLKFIDSHSHGELVSRMITDVDQFADGLLMGFSQLFTGVITILGTLLFMLSIHV